MKKIKTTNLIILAAIIVLLSRLPFLVNGYGNDSDAWRVVNAARYIATTEQYKASRLPGYPLQEIVYSLIWKLGGRMVAFNMTTALLSVLCFVFFCLYLYKLQIKDFLPGGITLAFTPTIFIHSTDSMDYIWTLAFILGSFYFILKDWQLIGGVCLGLAIGCRITSGAMLIPASLMLFHQCGKLDLQRFLKLLLPALLIGICSYIPAALTYGSAFFSFVDTYPSIPEVIYEASIIVWGIIGSLAILFSVIALLLDGHFKKSVSIPGEKLLIIAWVAGLLLYVIAFLRLPHDGAYLIPAVPFIILLLHRFLKRRYFISICLAIILSSFILNFEKTGFYLSGPIIRDYKARQATNTLVEQITLLNDAPKEKRVIVSGWFLPMIEANLDSDKNGLTKYVNLLTSSELQDYRNRGYEIYYLSEIREYNLQVFNIDLDKEGGKILRVPGKN